MHGNDFMEVNGDACGYITGKVNHLNRLLAICQRTGEALLQVCASVAKLTEAA